jgi:hypothetical protein
MRSESRRLARALRELTGLRWKKAESNSFSEDNSLLVVVVVVSLLGRPDSALPRDPRLRWLVSVGLEGDVTSTDGPSRIWVLRNGEDPARDRRGNLVNLICCTGLWGMRSGP